MQMLYIPLYSKKYRPLLLKSRHPTDPCQSLQRGGGAKQWSVDWTNSSRLKCPDVEMFHESDHSGLKRTYLGLKQELEHK